MFKSKFFLSFLLLVFLLNLGMSSKGDIFSKVYYAKGVMALYKEDYPEAINLLKKALKILPESEKIKSTLATAFNNYSLSLGNIDKEKSIELLEEAVLLFPSDQLLKNNLANVYNEWGLALQREKNIEGAIEKLRKALEIYPAGKTYQNNLGYILGLKGYGYFVKGEFSSAIDIFTEAIKYAPENSDLWGLLGETYYKSDNLEDAIICWKKAERLRPEDKDLKKKLSKVKKEWSVQKNFEEFSSSYFQIKFSPSFSRDKAYEIYEHIKEAVWSVRRDLGFSPKNKFSIFVYPSDQFGKIFGSNKHLVGLYDGKIHLNIDKKTTSERIAELIRHEYTHMAISRLSRERCPFWLNEGLARFEEKKDSDVDFRSLKKIARQNKIIPLSELSGTFSQLEDFTEASLAYTQSHSMVKYIIDDYGGLWVIRKMLVLFGKGKTEREVIKEVLHIEPETLEEKWKKKLIYE